VSWATFTATGSMSTWHNPAGICRLAWHDLLLGQRPGPDSIQFPLRSRRNRLSAFDWYDKGACHTPQEAIGGPTTADLQGEYKDSKLVQVDLSKQTDMELVELQFIPTTGLSAISRSFEERGGNPAVKKAWPRCFGNPDETRRVRRHLGTACHGG